eukprot:COSAG01_NODE_174_length_23022_cov_528.590978_4_plen_90_part_00
MRSSSRARIGILECRGASCSLRCLWHGFEIKNRPADTREERKIGPPPLCHGTPLCHGSHVGGAAAAEPEAEAAAKTAAAAAAAGCGGVS